MGFERGRGLGVQGFCGLRVRICRIHNGLDIFVNPPCSKTPLYQTHKHHFGQDFRWRRMSLTSEHSQDTVTAATELLLQRLLSLECHGNLVGRPGMGKAGVAIIGLYLPRV